MFRAFGFATVGALVLTPALALAHPERPSYFPDGTGTTPQVRHTGPKRVVCKPDSKKRIAKWPNGKAKRRNLALLKNCRYEHVQAAVNDAKNGERILILPGVYREEPSRKFPNPDPKCEQYLVESASRDTVTREHRMVASYEYQLNCPNAQQLVAILGDGPDEDRKCDSKCNIQIQGTGRGPKDVRFVGDPTKQNIFKADRADGIVFYNMTAEVSDYNNFYVQETDGFRYDRIISRWSNEYGFLSFASDHGLYEDLDAYGHGDSGVYPGSGPELHGERFGIVLRRVNAHHNLQGNAGSAGNSLLYVNNDFHHNGVGLVVDSFSSGHPGSPTDSTKFVNNRIYSNNQDYFSAERDEYCREQDYTKRDPKIVCPAIMVPVGVGILIAGGNQIDTTANYIYDNWRYGTMLFFVESYFRGEDPPAPQDDTSHYNRFVRNYMGVTPAGMAAPNGTDFWWDEQGAGNCWENNIAAPGAQITGDPAPLPACPGNHQVQPVNFEKHAFLVPCASWDPVENTDPPGCDWMTLPPKPE